MAAKHYESDTFVETNFPPFIEPTRELYGECSACNGTGEVDDFEFRFRNISETCYSCGGDGLSTLIPDPVPVQKEISPSDLIVGGKYQFKLNHWKLFKVVRVDFVGSSYIITNSESGDDEHCTRIDNENCIFKEVSCES